MIRNWHTSPAAQLPVQAAHSPAVTVVAASRLQPEAPTWIWTNHLAAGKFTLLGGGPGTGKTTIAMAVAATVSVGSVGGRHWPDGSHAPQGDVLIWTCEDGIEDTLLPRLIAAEADLSRVHFIRETTTAGRVRAFDPATDIPLLARELSQHPNVRLLVLDPIVQVVAGNANNNQEVRQAMEPLMALAEGFGCAVLGISHLNKGSKNKSPIERITGSLAFTALARVVWMTSRVMAADAESPTNVLVKAKANIGLSGGGFEYGIESKTIPAPNTQAGFIETSRVVWGDRLTGTAEEILNAAQSTETSRDASAVDRASQFLVDALSAGPRTCQDIYTLAEHEGISSAALKRAKMAGRPAIRSEKIRGAGAASGFMWTLMPLTSPQDDGPRPAFGSPSAGMSMPSPFAPSMGASPELSAVPWWQDGQVMPGGMGGFGQTPMGPFAGVSPTPPLATRPSFPVIPLEVLDQGFANAPAGPVAPLEPVAPRARLAPVEPVARLDPVAPVAPVEPVHQVVASSPSSPMVAAAEKVPPGLPQSLVDWACQQCVRALERDPAWPELDFDDLLVAAHDIAVSVADNFDFETDDEAHEDALRGQLYQELKGRQWWVNCRQRST